MSDESDDSIDPAEIYTQEEFIAQENILQSFGRRIEAKMSANMEAGSSRNRRYTNRNREGAHAQLMADYFSENPLYSDSMFRRRFRMRRPVFLRIVNELGAWSSYFTQRVDCTGRLGLSPLQKCTTAIRMLAYGTAADMLNEYLKVAESTALECLEKFVQGVIEVQKSTNSNPCLDDVRRRNFAIRSHSAHSQLKNDLIEHIWQRYGTSGNN
jgi:hypothetical protein